MLKQPFETDHQPVVTQSLSIHTEQDPGWAFGAHSHRDIVEFSYTLSGRFFYTCGSAHYHLGPGSLFIKNPGMIHSESADPSIIGHQIHFMVQGIHLKNLAANTLPLNEKECVFLCGEMSPLIESLINEIVSSNHSEAFRTRLIDTLLFCILEMTEKKQFQVPEEMSGQTVIEEIRHYIDVHYRDNLRLSDLAEHFYISEYYLSRKFREMVGVPFSVYVNRVRIGEAQRMLVFEDVEIKEIARRCGYHDSHYFFRIFREITGMTPSVYRTLYRKNAFEVPDSH